MAKVEVANGSLIVRMNGWHKLLAFRSSLKVPLERVAEVTPYQDVTLEPRAVRVLGTAVPGGVSAGIHRRAGEWEFWDVTRDDSRSAIVIELAGGWFSRLVLDVADPGSVVETVRGAAQRR